MKFIGKVLLVFSFVVTYLVLLILITAKYQFLNNDFWIQSFRQGEVYSKLENPLQKSIREVFIKEGAGTSEAKEISSILEKETLQVLVERNLINTLAFVNGKVSEITIFFPLEKLPKSIRQDLEINSDEFSLNYLLSTFGSSSSPVGSEIFVQIRSLGNYIIISLIVTIISLIINLALIYKLEETGKRLVVSSISFILSGIFGIIFSVILRMYVINIAGDLTQLPNREPAQIVLGTILPPLSTNITNLWMVISVLTIILGVLLLLIKKGGITINQNLLPRKSI